MCYNGVPMIHFPWEKDRRLAVQQLQFEHDLRYLLKLRNGFLSLDCLVIHCYATPWQTSSRVYTLPRFRQSNGTSQRQKTTKRGYSVG